MLIHGAANPLGDAAVDLTLDDGGVDHGATVLRHHIALDIDLPGFRIYLHDDAMAGIGKSAGADASRIPLRGLETRLLARGKAIALDYRRAGDLADADR